MTNTNENPLDITLDSIGKVGGIIIGIDIGSTTAKLAVFEGGRLIYQRYERHFSQVRQKTLEMIKAIEPLLDGKQIRVAIAGSAGMGMANAADLPFVQEVFATGETVKALAPETSTVIELGGEDAKVIFLKGGTDERMNGSCAGGTGAFIDQMATLLDVTNEEMDKLSLEHKRIFPIASRCGVFAKTDIQPLLNQGAAKSDIAASIYQAVVNQTIAGLAQGRKIEGNVMFLGGPLHYCMGLRERFVKTLKLTENEANFPDYALYAVSIGAALIAAKQTESYSYDELTTRLENAVSTGSSTTILNPLFANRAEYDEFITRHSKATVKSRDIATYSGNAYLGIDCGSTTTKLTLIAEDAQLLYTYYDSNRGNPVEIVRQQLKEIYQKIGERIKIVGSAVTGYGEELIKHAFHIDSGIVETIAHYTAAKYFNKDVDFILDIGGQDIKCFKIRNDSIDSIMLNEACSSGCGSFIETFAKSMGYEIAEFSRLGLFAKAPVDLGTRCTVFMNSSVKQAQKDGATVEDISAGLSISVVKNAIYKVIRASSAKELGENIVVQGGTFLNDAVLRSFENEIGHNVIRPEVAGLMGAYGAALYAMSVSVGHSSIISPDDLESFTYKSKAATCNGCTNNCRLTVNIFSNGERFISGNQCEKGLGKSKDVVTLPNMYAIKREMLEEMPQTADSKDGGRGTIGLPLALGMYELAPLWHGIFTDLNFKVILSGFSTREIYSLGQYSIPSDTACYPAKIMHGHIEKLIDEQVDAIFYPCLSYNIDEGRGDNHYNCPVVAYYSELLDGNMEDLQKVKFLYPYLNINNKRQLTKELHGYLNEYFDGISKSEIKHAIDVGFAALQKRNDDVFAKGQEAIAYARKNNMRIMILSGRPYHIDPEICHGIDKLASSLGFVVISEDCVAPLAKMPKVNVLNQWTYHSRLYAAAQYTAEHDDCELVQLVSFGCGVDAITTDEVRAILERNGKLYTQIKIDEITNLGAVKIRLRSLLGAIEERENNK